MISFRDQISRWDYLLAFIAGLCLVFSFAPFGGWPLAWVVPAVFFWINLKGMPRGQRMRLAWLFGVGVFAGGTHWIFYSIHFFGGANSFVAGLMTTLFVVGVAAVMMLFGWLLSFFTYQTRLVKLLLVFPAAWGLTEWFRSWFLTGFPWLQLGHSQADNMLTSYAPVIGSMGVSWIVALGAGALVLLLIGSLLQRLIALSVFLLIVGGAYGLGTVQWTQPTGEKLYISMIQGNIAQQDKWLPELRNQHIQTHIDLMEPHIMNSHLVIWPETAIPDTFQQSMEDVILPLQEVFKAQDNDLLVGGFQYDQATASMYNGIMAIGKNLEVYGKRHLVPFSEYIPFLEYVRWLENFVILPYDNVTPWKGSTNLTLAGQPMRMSVCYEDAYGEEMTDGLPEATMLVNLSNDGWFTGSIEAQQHAQIARWRALETGRYLLRATNNGVSAIIDDKGRVTATAPQYQPAVIAGYAQPMQGSTPYIRWGNWPLVVLLAALLAVIGWLGRGKFR